ncbi:hypothetical protein LY76DRAFT_301208 [Colletotrichum caudatum]|nr:hypothetical protein LY76DRAFT_301208 [Colletotrichum caudatum]
MVKGGHRLGWGGDGVFISSAGLLSPVRPPEVVFPRSGRFAILMHVKSRVLSKTVSSQECPSEALPFPRVCMCTRDQLIVFVSGCRVPAATTSCSEPSVEGHRRPLGNSFLFSAAITATLLLLLLLLLLFP